MISFTEFPPNLRFSDHELSKMSLNDLQNAFDVANKTLFADELKRWQRCMWSAIERVRNNPSNATMQSVVYHLEEYKRRLGRQYAAQYSMRTMLKYNEVERDIRWLVQQYELQRQSRPYFLGPKYY